MIPFLLMIWVPTALIGTILSLIMAYRARQVMQLVQVDPDVDSVDQQLARAIHRREGIHALVMFLLLTAGLLITGSQLSPTRWPWTLYWPAVMTIASLLLSIGTIISFYDDHRLKLDLILERKRKEKELVERNPNPGTDR